jgi:uncharacterized protein
LPSHGDGRITGLMCKTRFPNQWWPLGGLLSFLFVAVAAFAAPALAQLPFEEGVAAPVGATEPLGIDTADGVRQFRVEIAADEASRAKGLMFRTAVPAGTGMLFDFSPARPVAFWMKSTLIPLDMLFIGPDGRISNIAERTIPQSLTPVPSDGAARGVLEIAGGAASRLGIRPGDRVHHRLFPE